MKNDMWVYLSEYLVCNSSLLDKTCCSNFANAHSCTVYFCGCFLFDKVQGVLYIVVRKT